MDEWIEDVVKRSSNIESYPNPGNKNFEYGVSGIRFK